MHTKIDISFLIVNYHSERSLRRCVDDVKKIAHDCAYEIIVGNNDSDSLDMGEEIKCIEIGKNIGFGRAQNIIAKHAVGDILCILNPDTYNFSTNFLDIIQYLKKDSVGIVAPQILTSEGVPEEWSCGDRVSPYQILKNNLHLNRKLWESQKIESVDWVSGCAFFITKKLFEEIEGFDDRFFLYYEDVDLCMRVIKKNYAIIRNPHASLVHVSGESSRKNTQIQKKYYYTSQDIYIRKHYSRVWKKVVKIIRNILIKR